MMFSNFQLKRIQELSDGVILKNSQSEHMNSALYFGYRVEGLSVTFYEVLPKNEILNVKTCSDMIRAEYNSYDNKWIVFFRNCYGDWNLYLPLSSVCRFEKIIEEIDLFISNRILLVAFQ